MMRCRCSSSGERSRSMAAILCASTSLRRICGRGSRFGDMSTESRAPSLFRLSSTFEDTATAETTSSVERLAATHASTFFSIVLVRNLFLCDLSANTIHDFIRDAFFPRTCSYGHQSLTANIPGNDTREGRILAPDIESIAATSGRL